MVIAIANHKGGTGKTTSTINIGKSLSDLGKKVLLVDLDPQGNLTYSLGLNNQYNVADVLLRRISPETILLEKSQMHIIPANLGLYEDEQKIIQNTEGEFLLKKMLAVYRLQYDYILLDCPPAMSIYTKNALMAADAVLIPLVYEILAIQGLDQIINEISKISAQGNPDLFILGVFGVIVNESRKLSEEVLAYVRDHYKIHVFNNHIRTNVKAAEAPSFASSVLEYAPTSASARDYRNLTNELLNLTEKEKINN